MRQRATALLLFVLSVAITGCGASSSAGTRTRAVGARKSVSFDAPTLTEPRSAPPLALGDANGDRVNIASYRGRAVLVTFVYTHCPDTCPLIVAKLHTALALLGPRSGRVHIIAVSTDPRGDTPAAVRRFVARHDMTGRMEYLIGPRAALAPVWRSWGVSASAPTAADRVGHSALIYGITASGNVTTVYPSNFTPSEIAHDVPILASL